MLQSLSKENRTPLNDVLRELFSNTQEFCLVVEKENKNLESGEAKDIKAFIEKKQTLLDNLYYLEKKLVDLITVEDKRIHERIIEKIKYNFSRMNALIKQNEILLNTHLQISTKVFELLKAKHISNTVNKYGYEKEGKLAALSKLEKVMPALGLNKQC